MSKKTAPIIKSRFGKGFGFKSFPTTPKKSTDDKKAVGGGFDPARFKTQHKG